MLTNTNTWWCLEEYNERLFSKTKIQKNINYSNMDLKCPSCNETYWYNRFFSWSSPSKAWGITCIYSYLLITYYNSVIIPKSRLNIWVDEWAALHVIATSLMSPSESLLHEQIMYNLLFYYSFSEPTGVHEHKWPIRAWFADLCVHVGNIW